MLNTGIKQYFRLSSIEIIPKYEKKGFFKKEEKLIGYDTKIVDDSSLYFPVTRMQPNGDIGLENFLKIIPKETFGFDDIDKNWYFKGSDGTIFVVEFKQIIP